MTATREQTVKDYNVTAGQSYRGDCPFCSAHHTFVITNTGYELKWFCFSAACHSRGVVRAGVSGDTKRMLLDRGTARDKEPPKFVHPPEWVDMSRSSSGLDYLKRMGCWSAFTQGRVNVKYDLKRERVVFISPNGGCGRSLTGTQPKWYKYGINEGVIVKASLEKDRSVVLVEDPPSACAVSELRDSFALTGVHLAYDMMVTVRENWDEVIVALDKDASKCAIDIADVLRYYVDKVRVVFLDDDLKFLNTDEIKEKVG